MPGPSPPAARRCARARAMASRAASARPSACQSRMWSSSAPVADWPPSFSQSAGQHRVEVRTPHAGNLPRVAATPPCGRSRCRRSSPGASSSSRVAKPPRRPRPPACASISPTPTTHRSVSPSSAAAAAVSVPAGAADRHRPLRAAARAAGRSEAERLQQVLLASPGSRD